MELARRGRARWLLLLVGIALVTACGGGAIPLPSEFPSFPGGDGTLATPPGPVPRSLSGQITTAWDQNDPDNVYDATFVIDVKLKADVIGTAEEGGEGFASYVDDGSTWTYDGHIRTRTEDPAGICDIVEERMPNGGGGFEGGGDARSISGQTRLDIEGWTLLLDAQVNDIPGPHTITEATMNGCQERDVGDVWSAGLSCIAPWLAGNRFEFPGDCLDLPHVQTRGTLTGT
jgi:hypothetical protein